MNNIQRSLYDISRGIVAGLTSLGSRGVVLAMLLLVIIALFLVPLPPPVLDVLLVVNIVVALVLLLRSAYLNDPTKMFSFPTILLFTTLFRLALNVSSTRLILLNGEQGIDAAGDVIQAFGRFVVAGDFAVGAIIFSVIAVVNFVVIAKGSARVAEVAARFTLDALPGKQLAIDAELRAGGLTQEEAARRRDALSRESQFYGAMDGAMKFVQGDAIAGFVITFINAVGGVSIGLSRGLSFSDAVNTFGVLTIGDGLVSILPSLLISVCAGIVVTHVGGRGRESSSSEMMRDIASEPQSVIIAALAMLSLAVIPGFPFLPFFLVGVTLLVWVGNGWRHSVDDGERAGEFNGQGLAYARSAVSGYLPESDAPRGSQQGNIALSYFQVQPLSIEVDPDLLGPFLVQDSTRAAAMQQYSNFMRDKRYKRSGILLPAPVVVSNAALSTGQYRIVVRERVVSGGTIAIDELFVVANEATVESVDIAVLRKAAHPLDGRVGCWISQAAAGTDALSHIGVEILEPQQYLVLEAVAASLQAIDEVFGLDEVKQLLEIIKHEHRSLIEAVFDSGMMSYGEFSDVMRRLIREHVSVRDLKLILEGIIEYGSLYAFDGESRSEWLGAMHSFLRRVLSRSIVSDSLGPGGELRTFVLSQDIEDEFRSAVALWDEPRTKPPLEPNLELTLRDCAQKMFAPVLERGALPVVVLCSADIRPAVQKFFDAHLHGPDWFRTIAFEELGGQYSPESVGVLACPS